MIWFDSFIELFGCAIEVFLIYDFFRNFFQEKIEKKYVKYLDIGACIVLFGVNQLENATLNLITFPVLMWILVSIIFECKAGVRLGYLIIGYVVMMAGEFLFVILSETTADMLARVGVVTGVNYGWEGILTKLINYIIFLLLKQMSGKSNNRMTNKIFYIYLCVPISTLGIMLTVFYSGIDFSGKMMFKTLLTAMFVFIIIGNMLLFYAFQKYTENLSQENRQQMELAHKNAEIERLSQITEINEEYNETVHNITHSLKVIEHLVEENRIEEINDVIQKITGNLVKRENYEYSNYKMLNTILSEYAAKAEESRVKMELYVEPGCKMKRIEDIDFASMLGNIFDNAITAASQVKDAKVQGKVFMNEKGKMCIIKVINDYEKELKTVDGRVLSTKDENGIHGIGLTSISKTAEKYGGSFHYYTEDKKFYAVLIFPIE